MRTVFRILFRIEGAWLGYFIYICFQQDMRISFLWCPILIGIGVLGGLSIEEGMNSYAQEGITLLLGLIFIYPLARLLEWAITFVIAIVELIFVAIRFFIS